MENAGGKPNRGDNATATAALLHAYLEGGDITARDRLIELYLPLVESFAHHYERSEDYDDLFQAGCIGLINAIDRFDLKRGGELAAFAVPNIVGEIKRHLRDRTHRSGCRGRPKSSGPERSNARPNWRPPCSGRQPRQKWLASSESTRRTSSGRSPPGARTERKTTHRSESGRVTPST